MTPRQLSALRLDNPMRWRAVIHAAIERQTRTRSDTHRIKLVAKELQVSERTLWRWLRELSVRVNEQVDHR